MTKYQLNEQQVAFLQQFIIGKKKGDQKKTTNAYTDYCRREDKVVAEVEKLEPDSETRAAIERDLGLARAMKDKGNFKGAYAALDSVKKTARRAAKGYVSSLNPGEIKLAMYDLEIEADAVWHMINDVLTDAEQLRPDKNPVLKGGDIRATMQEASRLRVLMEPLPAAAKGARQAATGLEGARRLDTFTHQVDTLESAGDKKQQAQVTPLRDYLTDVEKGTKIKGQYLWDIDIKGIADHACRALDDWLAKGTPGNVTAMLDDIPGAKDQLNKVQISDGKGGTKTGFEALKEREDARVAWAKQKMSEAFRRDKKLLPPNPNDPLEELDHKPPVELRKFAVGDVLDTDLDEDLSEETVASTAKDAAENLRKLIEEEVKKNPDSDILFDLILKNEADLTDMIGKEAGWPTDRGAWSEDQTRAAATIAAALRKQVMESSPNKMSQDGKTLTVGGKPYTKEQKLGDGSFGEVHRFIAQDGSEVVVKSLLKPQMRNDMVTELEMHRRAMGGENGQPHPNVVPLRGVALDPNGALMMMMDEAKGGSGDQFSRSMLAAQDSGALTKEARDALARNTFAQMAEGMKHVHDCNVTHNDIKGANFLFASDGTPMVADLGSGRVTDEEGIVEWDETEQGRTAREKKLEEVRAQIEKIEKQLKGAEQGEGSDAKEDKSSSEDKSSAQDIDVDGLNEQLVALYQDETALSEPGPEAYKLLKSRYGFTPATIRGGNAPSTMAFSAPDVNKPGVHSTKSDVFMLGTMLDMLTKDTYDSEVNVGGLYSVTSRQTGHQGTALDRLRNQMLDSDPSKRPSLDSVLGSAYLDQSDFMGDFGKALDKSWTEGTGHDGMLGELGKVGPDHAEEDIKKLQTALGAYSSKVGRKISPLQEQITASKAVVRNASINIEKRHKEIVVSEKDAQDKKDSLDVSKSEVVDLEKEIARAQKENDTSVDLVKLQGDVDELKKTIVQQENALDAAEKKYEREKIAIANLVKAFAGIEKKEAEKQKAAREKIDEINKDPEVAKLLDAIARASEPFGGAQETQKAA